MRHHGHNTNVSCIDQAFRDELSDLVREARRRTKVVGAFPAGQSALMLVAARLRHVSTTQWGSRKYMNVGLLKEMDREVVFAAA